MADSTQDRIMARQERLKVQVRGTRRDGIYETPNQHRYDDIYLPQDCLPNELDLIRDDLDLNEKDVILAGFPKTGTTWMAEVLYLICNNADLENASRLPTKSKLVMLDFNFSRRPGRLESIQSMASPRLISTHLPSRLFQKNLNKVSSSPKIVVTMRNPKDTLVSFFHFYQTNPGMGRFDGDWDEFFELFRQQRLVYEDMFVYNQAWWRMRDDPNVCIVKYEEMKKHPRAEIDRICQFLEYPLSTEQIGAIAEGTTFEAMKKDAVEKHSDVYSSADNPKINFFRKGEVGGWQAYFSDEQSRYIDDLCQEKYSPIGLSFDC